MTPATLLASARALIEADPDAFGLLDRCTGYNVTFPTGASGGSTVSDGAAVFSSVPCMVEARTFKPQANTADVLGDEATHSLYLIASNATGAIKPNYKLVVSARDHAPQLTFTSPVRLDESLGPLIHVAAVLKV